MLLDDDGEEKTTRFVVAYEEPSGDEQADFAKMLSQFRAKVAENLGTDDVRAHQDLGTAYKEMGLWDEAVKAFEKVMGNPAREVQCRLMIGLCRRDAGNLSEAVHSFKAALHARQCSRGERAEPAEESDD